MFNISMWQILHEKGTKIIHFYTKFLCYWECCLLTLLQSCHSWQWLFPSQEDSLDGKISIPSTKSGYFYVWVIVCYLDEPKALTLQLFKLSWGLERWSGGQENFLLSYTGTWFGHMNLTPAPGPLTSSSGLPRHRDHVHIPTYIMNNKNN